MGQPDTIMARGPGMARSLSPYFADNAARLLAQPVHTDAGPRSAGMRLHGRAAGGTLIIITLRRRLTAGCRSGAAIVTATVRADYPCSDGTPLISLFGLPAGNYTLRITNGGITARAADGQYFRISPVSRP